MRVAVFLVTFFALSTVPTLCGFSASKNSGAFLRKPPDDIINRRPRGDGGNEYGIRQLSATETRTTVLAWKKALGVAAGAAAIDRFEMLETLSQVAAVMPGKLPQRHEFLAFGELVDGNVECLSAVYCGKVTCPWELDVIAIAQSPSRSGSSSSGSSSSRGQADDDLMQSMVDFLNALCKENAILPNYLPLERYSAAVDIYKYLPRALQRPNFGSVSSTDAAKAGIADPMPDQFWNPGQPRSSLPASPTTAAAAAADTAVGVSWLDVLVVRYVAAHQARPHCLCLDRVPQVDLGLHWFRLFIPHPTLTSRDGRDAVTVPVYLRQKLAGVQALRAAANGGSGSRGAEADGCGEFEILFTRPVTGTTSGSGTVGGALILSEERALEMLPQASPQLFDVLRREIAHKVLHPDLDWAELQKWAAQPPAPQRPPPANSN